MNSNWFHDLLGVSAGAFGASYMQQMDKEQGQDNTANLKGKLSNQNEILRQLTENLNVHKKEV